MTQMRKKKHQVPVIVVTFIYELADVNLIIKPV